MTHATTMQRPADPPKRNTCRHIPRRRVAVEIDGRAYCGECVPAAVREALRARNA